MFAIISRGKTRDEYLGQHQQVAIRSFFSPRFFVGLPSVYPAFALARANRLIPK